MNRTAVPALALAVALLGGGTATAKAGARDGSFGSSGAATAAGVEATAIAVQADGKIVAAGWRELCPGVCTSDFVLARFTPTGFPDSTFGQGGTVTTDFGATDRAYAIALQADSKIVVAGCTDCEDRSPSHLAVARYDATGSLDETFGSGGKVIMGSLVESLLPLVFTRNDHAYGVAVQPDGKIVLGGFGGAGFQVVRLLPNGSPDPSFRGDEGGAVGMIRQTFNNADTPGVVFTPFSDPTRGYALALQADGKILLAGERIGEDELHDGLVVCYLPDGKINREFGADGVVTLGFNSLSQAIRGIAIQPDGAIIVAGSAGATDATNHYNEDFAVARLTHAGSADPSFGYGGFVTTDFAGAEPRHDRAGGITVFPDGKIVVAGLSLASGTQAIALARYLPDGRLDPSFGEGGRALSGVGWANAIERQTDGKALVAGAVLKDGQFRFAVERYLMA